MRISKWVISIGIVAVPIAIFVYGHESGSPDEQFLAAVFFFYISSVLFLSLRYRTGLLLFVFLNGLFKSTSIVGGKHRAGLYGGLAFVAGLVCLLNWLSAG